MINRTFRYRFRTLPWGARIVQVSKCDFDVWMVLPDPVEDWGGFLEGHDDEQMLGFGTAAHGER